MSSKGTRTEGGATALTPEQKRARLAELLRNKTREGQRLPVSFGQERLWFQDRLSPGSAAFNIPVAVRLSGTLDDAALRASLQELVQRHASLRTTFVEEDGRPLQRVAASGSVSLPVVDLQAIPEAGREAEAWRRLTEASCQPFDLEQGPLLRTVLYRLDVCEHVLLLNLHHIVSDGWSLGVLVRELSALYPALAAGQASPLPAPRMQYADYAAWQREYLQGEVLESQIRWWRERLDPDAVLELPTDRPRPAIPSGRGARLTVVLPPARLEALKALALAEGGTLFTVLLAGFQALLHRYTGQQDIVVGTSVAGRGRAELEGLIGLFTNTLALRTDLSGQPGFRALLGRVRETTLGAYAHQDVPFEKLVDALKPGRQLSVAPLFQVALTLQNAPMPPLRLPGLVMDAQPVDNRTAKADVSLLAVELPGAQGLRLAAEYNTDLFEPGSIQRMLAHLSTLLEAAVATPDLRISELPLMDPAEHAQVRTAWTGASAPFPEACLHTLFEAQARRTPDAVALRFRGQSLTYAQLDARANQLAHALRRRGVGPEVRVALSVERSLDLPVGLLGILKAGGAWVPVDALLPRERLGFMLEDSGATVLVTVSTLREHFPEAHHARALCLDTETDALARESTEPPVTGVGPRHLAYLLYTSGSTGQPKGTAIEHRGVANLVTHEAVAYGIGPGSRVLQFANPSFDLSVEEVFTTLCSGATLVLAPLEELMPGAPLQKLLRDEAVTVISLTPAALAATPAEGLPELRTVISGGEALPAEVVARWATPERRFLNTYGPTEATVVATLTECVADGRVPAIGRPLANVRTYVLDARGEPVPVGVKGELFIGGVGVARGYAGRPGLTAERFVPDAFSGEAGARLYRTGDVVRWREDGTLEFVGRADAQVKVRGFRIELGEVEAALSKLPEVREAAVMAREDGPGGKRLVGYVVAHEGAQADSGALRAALKKTLPEYMVPSAIVVLPVMPLTANGKVDRKALPAADLAGMAAREYVAPRTPTEERLAGLWQELLGVKRVGAEDSFFDLGGHSLLATQAVSRIRQAFGVELPLRRLFESPTVEAVARLIDEALAGRAAPAADKRRESRPRPRPTRPLEDIARELEARSSTPHAAATPEEVRRLLAGWNATASEYPRDSTLAEVFASVVARFPDKVAVEFGDAQLTYRQLDARANGLAWHLRGLGVSTDSRVAVALDRSLELIVSLVAILKAGGAYVPLDSSYPRERLAAMVEDSVPQALVTTRAFVDSLPVVVHTVLVEEVLRSDGPTHAPPSTALPSSLAYIDFTSGSTGRPKGVGTPQAGVLRTVFGVDYAHLGPDETFLLIAPVSFDASTLELWGPLLHGARLVVFPPRPPTDLKELESVLVKHGVTTLHLTAGLFTQVVEHGLSALRGVKQLLTGGDVVSAPHVRRVLEELRIPVTACYGPTEGTLFTSCHRMTDVAHVGTSVPIGRPIGNTQVYLLDASGQLVPPGVTGELFVGGDGVARGYVGQPALTAERFVPDSFSGVPGARLYRTGDLARWRRDGVLEFLGRADVQVKVRGYRIELPEIEATLLACAGVKEAVVLAREDAPGDKRLVGYVVASEPLDPGALRALLKERLPEYMVPSAVVVLDALPLTSHGKVDRKALPAPDAALLGRVPSRSPRTDTERLLATLFEEVLRTGTVGAGDDFFELGGHSLSATQVLSRIRRAFQVELPLAAFFTEPTVEAVARRLESLGAVRNALAVPALKPAPRDGGVPLSFAQQRLWFFAKLEPESAAYNLPAAVRLEGALDVPALTRALRALQQRHESLRTTFREQAAGPVQVIAPEPSLPAGWMDLEPLAEKEREDGLRGLIEDEARQVFDLEAGPLWRVLLVRLGDPRHVLLLTMHHVISDAWSMGVLIHELTTLYAAHLEGRTPELKPLPVQYPDFSVWQRDWLRDAALEAQLGWWRQQLHGAPRALELPTDRPRPRTQSFRGAAWPFQFPRALSEAMHALCRREGVTPSMVVLAAFQALLSRYSGQEDLSVGTPIAGRHHAELEGLIGFFVNTLVLRTRLDGDPTFRELLGRVRDVALGAYEHQDVPFEKLVEAVRPERDPSRAPLFQVMYAYQNAPMPEMMGPGLSLHRIEVEGTTAKFDLTLALSDTDGGLKGVLEYNTDLFDGATAGRMVGHLRTLLEEALATPERRLSTLPMLTPGERKLLFHDWDQPAAATAGDACLERLLQAQARRCPETVAGVDEGRALTWAELHAHARQVLRGLRARGVVAPTPPPPLVPVPRTGPVPLSFAQQRLWFVDQFEPGGATYNMPAFVRLEGALDVAALRRALSELVLRHEALRTTFIQEDGEPRQRIAPHEELRLDLVDLEGLAPEAAEEALRRLMREELRHGFNLATGPLIHARLWKRGPREHVLALNMHHIVSDAWSMGVLVREVAALYEAFSHGRPSPLPPLPLQYADYALWQRQWLKGEVLDEQLAWWRQHLSGLATLELPTDRPRPPVQTFNGAQVPVALSPEASRALRSVCQKAGATPFMALLAAYQVLLSRYAGQQDITVGSPIAGRHHGEVEGLVGFFVNTLVLRTQVDTRASFLHLLRQVRETALGAYAHQDVPFEQLVDALQPARDLSRGPLFQVLFVLQNAPLPSLRHGALTLQPLEVEGAAAKFELQLSLTESPEGYQGSLGYNTDLFEAGTAARMAEHFRVLVEALVSRPEAALGSVSMLPEAERRQVLVEWNATATEYPRGATVAEVFAQVVARFPDKVAVEFGDAKLTYRQLDARANGLAWHLRGLGVSTDSRVALALDRSLELMVSLVAILKAGGAYVPLDPSYPRERLAAMVEDARPTVLVTSRELLARLPVEGLSPVVLGEVSLEAQPASAPPSSALPQSLAYIDFTSGSTGRPKGVGIPQAAVLRTVLGVDYTHFGPEETFLQLAPISFDASTFEIWGALLHGGRLVVMPPQAPSLEELARVIRKRRVTTLWLTAGLFTQVVEFHLEALRPVKHVLAGGDVLPAASVRRVLEELRIPVTNAYGPTETTVFATSFRVTDAAQVGASMPIGRPHGNTQVYVLDASGQPVPVGVIGELLIGGDGVARGYVEQPALTAERFIPDAFSGVPGARLYRTGDLVRWRKGGVLEFLGRIDAQVKVRGYRIELAEVEAALLAFPDVAQAVAVVREDVPGDKRLVGYVAAPGSLDMAALRASLKQRLPEYMAPSALVRLDTLALTANAKVDRKALPPPGAALTASTEAFVAPRTPTEKKLAEVFAAVLRVPQVSVTGNFFELGGHSLLATQVISRIRSQLEVELPLRALFEAPTVAALAERIESTRLTGSPLQAPALVHQASSGAVPLSFAQQRLWFIDQLQPGSAAYNMPAPVRLTGTLHLAALERSLGALIERHASLRTTFDTHRGEPVQVIHPDWDFQRPEAPPSEARSLHSGSDFQLPLVDLGALPARQREAEALRLATEDAARPFDLTRGPLFRASLLRLAPDEHVLLLNLHHIISDGWSLGVLVRELAALYEAHASGRTPQLAPLPLQYADYAVWQRSWLSGEVLESQLDYWKRQLAGAPQVLELPTDRPFPPVQTFSGAVHRFTLPAELGGHLEALARQHNATLFMVLLAAWQTLLHRYSGQDDLVVGSPIAGRNRMETEGLIGFFVNSLVLRAHVSDEDTFASLLGRVRETTLGAQAHQDVPFEKLVEALQPERNASRSPLFQVMFSLQNLPESSISLPGLKLSTLEVPDPIAKFELTLTMTPGPRGLSGSLHYNTGLFDASTVARMAGHLHTLLEAIATHPRQRLSELPLMREDERRQVVEQWNDTSEPLTEDARFHELFEAQAQRTPDAPALRFGEHTLSYRELDARANQLAHELRARGVGPEVRVALCVERSFDLVVGMLGVFKAGGAYVPMDPAYPRERLDFMLQDCDAPVLLTHSHLRDMLPAFPGDVLALDTEAPLLSRHPATAPARVGTADNLAYVIYTSGSTGHPKGVMVSHRGVPNVAAGIARITGLRPGQRVLQFASFSFDAAVYEVTLALMHGGTVVLARREELMPGQPLVDVLRGQAINQVLLPPSVLALLPTEGLETLGTLLSGGEACSAELVEKWAPGRQLFNAYGPTETTVIVNLHRCVRDGQRPPLGRSLPNTRVYVVDRHLRPVPIGVAGELCIGGVGVTRGYLHRPELTAEKFVPDPFGTGPGARLYRTGDLVRWRPDGTLDYVGRIDFQVKLRGFRIELGEIEAALQAHPGVRQAVALVREDVAGDKRLVAYVVPAPGVSPDTEALRATVRQRLPEHMVPSACVVLEALPLSPTGKVDRRQLPAPDAGRQGDDAPFIAPRTPLEAQLAAAFANVLRVPRVSVSDDFFALGGHSLLALGLVSRIREHTGQSLPVSVLFQEATVERLARRMEQAPTSTPNLVKLDAGDATERPLFLVHGGSGSVRGYADLVRQLGGHGPVYGLQASEPEDGDHRPLTVEALARDYLAQVRAVQPRGPYLLGGWSFGGLVAYEMTLQLQAQGEQVALLALLDSQAPEARPRPPPDALGVLAAFGRMLGVDWQELSLDLEHLRSLGSREQLAYVLEQAKQSASGAPAWDADAAEQLFAASQRHADAQHAYVPGSGYAGPALLFRSALALTEAPRPEDLGWGMWLTGALTVYPAPGDHFTLLSAPQVTELAERLVHHLWNHRESNPDLPDASRVLSR